VAEVVVDGAEEEGVAVVFAASIRHSRTETSSTRAGMGL